MKITDFSGLATTFLRQPFNRWRKFTTSRKATVLTPQIGGGQTGGVRLVTGIPISHHATSGRKGGNQQGNHLALDQRRHREYTLDMATNLTNGDSLMSNVHFRAAMETMTDQQITISMKAAQDMLSDQTISYDYRRIMRCIIIEGAAVLQKRWFPAH